MDSEEHESDDNGLSLTRPNFFGHWPAVQVNFTSNFLILILLKTNKFCNKLKNKIKII